MEIRTREADGAWSSARYGAGDTARLTCIGVTLDVDRVYEDAEERD